MEKNLVLKLKGKITDSTAERLGYLRGTFYTAQKVENYVPVALKVNMLLKNINDIITFRKISGDVTFYKGTDVENLTEIKEDSVELVFKYLPKRLIVKDTDDFFYIKPNLGSKIEIGPSSNILTFGDDSRDWASSSNIFFNSSVAFNYALLLLESGNLLECDNLTKISEGTVINVTDASDIKELRLNTLHTCIIIPDSSINLNQLIDENDGTLKSLGNITVYKIKENYQVQTETSKYLKVELNGHNYTSDIIQFATPSVKVSYTGSDSDYPFYGKTYIRTINFYGDGTNFDNFFKAIAKYDTISSIDVKNVIITDASNSAIEQLKTKVTGIFKINNVDKKA